MKHLRRLTHWLCAFAATASVAGAGTITVSPAITSDATSGIDTANNYTHVIGGGASRTVNGVVFDALSPGINPPNFTWISSSNQSQLVATGGGSWAPGALAGTEMEALLLSEMERLLAAATEDERITTLKANDISGFPRQAGQ